MPAEGLCSCWEAEPLFQIHGYAPAHWLTDLMDRSLPQYYNATFNI